LVRCYIWRIALYDTKKKRKGGIWRALICGADGEWRRKYGQKK
jgi:hypothetical protein